MRIALLPGLLMVLHGLATASLTHAATQTNDASAETLFGIEAEQALAKGPYTFLSIVFDLDVFCVRVTGTLPASSGLKQQIQTTLKAPAAQRLFLKNAVAHMSETHLRFVGVRSYRNERELLFRNTIPRGDCRYTGLIVLRRGDSFKVHDIHDFETAELLSDTMRRTSLLETARKGLLVGNLNASDQAFVSGREAWEFFVKRCEYGKFDLIKEAFERLPPALQEERAALTLYADSGSKTAAELLVPLNRWRKLYPGDPCPDAKEVRFWWRLYEGPRSVQGTNGSWTEIGQAWQPDEEAQAVKAIERANVWLDDPAQLLRLARYYRNKQPARATTLFQEVAHRYPKERETYADWWAFELDARKFDALTESLHLYETAFETNLTATVEASPAFAEFRKSLAWKRWQHDYHGVDSKLLVTPDK